MCPLLPIWISKNICKNTKPCEFTFVKNKELLALFLQQILRTLKMPECLKPKNIQSLNWILLVLIKKKKCIATLPKKCLRAAYAAERPFQKGVTMKAITSNWIAEVGLAKNSIKIVFNHKNVYLWTKLSLWKSLYNIIYF